MIAAGKTKGVRRGKSGLHRAGCRITSGGGDSRDALLVTAGAHVNPIRSKTEQRHMAARQFQVGCLSHAVTHGLDR